MSFHSLEEDRSSAEQYVTFGKDRGSKKKYVLDDDETSEKSDEFKHTRESGTYDEKERDFEPVVKTKPTKTLLPDRGKSKTSTNLTSDQAVEFLIKERQAMDAVYAALREENEELRSKISQRGPNQSPDKADDRSDRDLSVAKSRVALSTSTVPSDVTAPFSELQPVLCDQLDRFDEWAEKGAEDDRFDEWAEKGAEDDRFDEWAERDAEDDRFDEWAERDAEDAAGSVSAMSFESASMASMGVSSTTSMHQRMATVKKKNVPALNMHHHNDSPTTNTPIPSQESARKTSRSSASSRVSTKKGKNRQYSGLPMELWKGTKLWKIPYTGTGLAEIRRVRIKHAPAGPGPRVKVIDVIQSGQDRVGDGEGRKGYMAFPPTLQWSNPVRPDDRSNCREMVLSKDDQIVEGHRSVSFLKGKSKGNPLPPEPLCFSIVTSSRSLDLAAENLEEAVVWKSALRELIGMLGSNSPGWAAADIKKAHKPAWREYLRSSSADDRREGEESDSASEEEEEEEEEEGDEEEGDDRSEAQGEGRSDIEEYEPDSNGSYQSATIAARKSSQRDKLFAAIESADYSAVERILLVGVVDVNMFDGNRLYTPLMAACKGALPEIARLCLQFGARVDVKNDTGTTALHYAAECGSMECTHAVLSATLHQTSVPTILPNVKNNEGKTALMICAEYGECALVKLLLAHGGDITAIDKKRKSCLHLCASYGHETCLAILLDSGADGLIEGQDLLGNTALHYTAKYGHLAATRLLLETAADPLVRNKNNRTAYDVASEQGHEEVCSLLFEYMNPSSPQNCTGSAQKSAMNTSPILTPHKTQSARAAAFKSMGQLPSERLLHTSRERSSKNMCDGVVVNSQGVRDNDKIDQVGYNLSSEGPTDYTQQGSEYDTFGDAGQIYEQQSYQDGPHAEGGHGSSDYLYEDEDYFQGDYESADYAYYGEKNDQGDAEGEIAPLEEFELNFSTWCVYESEEGYPYYLETSSQHSQWEDPRVHGILIVSDEYDGGDTAGTAEGGLTDGYDVAGDGGMFTQPRRITPKKPTPKKRTPKKPTPQKHIDARAKRSKPQRVMVELTPPRHSLAEAFSSSDDDDIRQHMMGQEGRRFPDGRGLGSIPRGPSTPTQSPSTSTGRNKLTTKSLSTSDVLSPDVMQGPPLTALNRPSTKKKTKKIVLMDSSPRRHAFGNSDTFDDTPQFTFDSPSRSAVHLASTLRRSLVLNSPRSDKKPSGSSEMYDEGSDWDLEEADAPAVPPKGRSRWDFEHEEEQEELDMKGKGAKLERARTAPIRESSRRNEVNSKKVEGRGKIYLPEEGAYGTGGNKFE